MNFYSLILSIVCFRHPFIKRTHALVGGAFFPCIDCICTQPVKYNLNGLHKFGFYTTFVGSYLLDFLMQMHYAPAMNDPACLLKSCAPAGVRLQHKHSCIRKSKTYTNRLKYSRYTARRKLHREHRSCSPGYPEIVSLTSSQRAHRRHLWTRHSVLVTPCGLNM